MSQLVLDDHLSESDVLRPIQQWGTAELLRQLRPDEIVLDDRVPQILLTLKQPTFVTIDQGFWNRRWCHPKYCILYFALRDDQQELLPALLRALLRQPEFRSRASRMGRVARVSSASIESWSFQASQMEPIAWAKRPRKK
jgi:hypothetical protein